jgi:cell division protein FtsL
MTRREFLLTFALAVSVLTSALLVVKTKHENRTLVQQIEDLRVERAKLDTEWAQLQLEEATLAQRGRVEQIARDKAGMVEPREQKTVEWKQP